MKDNDTEKKETPVTEETVSDEKPENAAEKEKSESKHSKKEKKELDELNEKYLRLYAEYENYRKRTDREKGESYNAGVAHAAEALLPVIDNIDRAMEYEPENEGLRMICKQIVDAFTRLGIEEIESDGKEFDPELHNAVMHEENEEAGENTITQTFQKGYTLGGKVIRHAVVKVAN